MSEIELVSFQTSQSDINQGENSETNQSDINQEENSDFVDWINNFAVEENFYLNFPHDHWRLICACVWTLVFIIFGIVVILMIKKK